MNIVNKNMQTKQEQTNSIQKKKDERNLEFEQSRDLRRNAQDLAFKIQDKYSKMISDLQNEVVSSKTYLKDEEGPKFSAQEQAELMDNVPFNTLYECKLRLKKAREVAEQREQRRDVLANISGKTAKTSYEEQELVKTLSPSQTEEYQRRLFSGDNRRFYQAK